MIALARSAICLALDGRNMNTPPNPPSPADTNTYQRRDAALNNPLVWRTRRAFFGSPFKG